MFSVLNVHKPTGMTSHDVVNRVRRVYGLKKVGHMGTLDPMAEGVLPVALGHATRLIEYFPDDKRYRAELTFGITTTTLDREGEVVSETACTLPPRAEIEEIVQAMTGTVLQKVPMYSAVHVGGKKLYELARKGVEVETPAREVTIHEILVGEQGVAETGHPTLTLDVHCSSGTYVRAIARDLGDALGFGAHLSALVRTAHGSFTVENAVPLEALMDSGSPQQYLQSPLPYLSIPNVVLATPEERQLLCNGMKIFPSETVTERGTRLAPNALYFATYRQEPIAVVRYESKKLRPLKVFAAPDVLETSAPS